MERVAARLAAILEWAVAVLFAVLIVLGGMQVFFRYVVGSSLTWTEEVSKIVFFYIIFLGASLAVRGRSFAAVDALYQFFPDRFRRLVDVAIWLAVAAYLVIVTVLGSQITLKTIHQITPALEIPQAVVYLAVPVGALVMLVPAVNILIGLFRPAERDAAC